MACFGLGLPSLPSNRALVVHVVVAATRRGGPSFVRTFHNFDDVLLGLRHIRRLTYNQHVFELVPGKTEREKVRTTALSTSTTEDDTEQWTKDKRTKGKGQGTKGEGKRQKDKRNKDKR
jgi:hypothetical protein